MGRKKPGPKRLPRKARRRVRAVGRCGPGRQPCRASRSPQPCTCPSSTSAPDASPRVYIAGDRFDVAPRAALGINTSSTGTLRDTLGLLVSSIVRGGPAEKAGLEEGNRIASINGVNLRSTKADLEDYEN